MHCITSRNAARASFIALMTLAARPAFAQSADRTSPEGSTEAPPPRTGFQLALRTGVALSMGTAFGPTAGAPSTGMHEFVPVQVPLVADVGYKLTPNLFVGAYGGIAVGGGGDVFGCGQGDVSCTSLSLRGGLLAQYHFLPDRKVDPWIGYGIGYEHTGVTPSNPPSYSVGGTFSLAGWDYAHLMAGADFRLGTLLGVGPFADFSLGRYTVSSTSGDAVNMPIGWTETSADLPSTALHEWLMLGVRGTLFP